jgi:hypothetical protein
VLHHVPALDEFLAGDLVADVLLKISPSHGKQLPVVVPPLQWRGIIVLLVGE